MPPKHVSAITIYVPHEVKDEISMLSKRFDVSESQFCRNLMLMSLEDIRFLESFKLVTLAHWVSKLKKQNRYNPDELKKAGPFDHERQMLPGV
jgi:hypothetical protein